MEKRSNILYVRSSIGPPKRQREVGAGRGKEGRTLFVLERGGKKRKEKDGKLR